MSHRSIWVGMALTMSLYLIYTNKPILSIYSYSATSFTSVNWRQSLISWPEIEHLHCIEISSARVGSPTCFVQRWNHLVLCQLRFSSTPGQCRLLFAIARERTLCMTLQLQSRRGKLIHCAGHCDCGRRDAGVVHGFRFTLCTKRFGLSNRFSRSSFFQSHYP